MKKSAPAATPDAYLNGLSGWQRLLAENLRSAVKAAGKDLIEVIRWGHLVYFSNGPVLLIRAEEARVLFGFLRGKRLRQIDARLVASGKYELATMQLREGDSVRAVVARRLTREAIRLNQVHGDPTKATPVKKKVKAAKKKSVKARRAAPQSAR